MIKPSQQAFEELHTRRSIEVTEVDPQVMAAVQRAHEIGVAKGMPDWKLGSAYFTNWALIGVSGTDYIQAQLITQVTDTPGRGLAVSSGQESGLRTVLRLRVKDPFRKIVSEPEIAVIFDSDKRHTIQQHGTVVEVSDEPDGPWAELYAFLDQLESANFDDPQGIYDGNYSIDPTAMIASRAIADAVAATTPAA